MSLELKRKQKDYMDKKVVPFLAEAKAVTGKELAFDVNWEGIDSDSKINWMTSFATSETLQAFKDICKDAMGKEAIMSSNFSKIQVLKGDTKATFNDGVLTLCAPWGDSYPGSGAIRQAIEKGL